MALAFPSDQFDDVVAAVCHGTVTEEEARMLNALLLRDHEARDEYLLRLELHARLASDPDLFPAANKTLPDVVPPRRWPLAFAWGVAAVALITALALVIWWPRTEEPLAAGVVGGAENTSVAMLDLAVDVEWAARDYAMGEPLDPGPLEIREGFVRIVLYSGARIVVKGPAQIHITSQSELSCTYGELTAQVPPQAKGLVLHTPHAAIEDLGTEFGVVVGEDETALHVLEGSVAVTTADESRQRLFQTGAAAIVDATGQMADHPFDRARFQSHFDLESKSADVASHRMEEWRAASDLKQEDPSLLVYFDFESQGESDPWQLRNKGNPPVRGVTHATIVGCESSAGRWPGKGALEFQSVNDRLRFRIPGNYEELTLAAWVCIRGLDRKINSLFMSDGFAAGTTHWLIREDGVLGLTVIGRRPGSYQILATPPEITLEHFGRWLHLAVVLDGEGGHVRHYINGKRVHENPLDIPPPYRIGSAELGNWNADGFGSPSENPALIRNFSGAMDEFFLFSRALNEQEIHALYEEGTPEHLRSTVPTDPE